MDLNHIELPAVAIVELYRNSLVGEAGVIATEPLVTKASPEQVSSEMQSKDEPTWRSLGDNQKQILIVLKSGDSLHLPDHELQFLAGILGACKLSIADVAIVNIEQQAAGYQELTRYFNSRIVLLFDIEPADFGLPMNFPHYQIQAFANNSFLYSPSLRSLEHDKVEKSKLWVSLKRLFNL
jgi:hypothetical protein